MSIFEKAARQKLRFESQRGLITVEHLFDLPLTAKDGFDLNSVAILANRQLKDAGEESFVDVAPNPLREVLALRLEVVKHVIATKQAEQAERAGRAARAQELSRLTAILADKQDEALKGLSVEDIQKRINELSK